VLRGHTSLLTSTVFSPDGKYALTGSFDTTAILWDLTQESKDVKPLKILDNHEVSVTSVAISPDNNFALTGSRGTTALWDLKNERIIATYTFPGGPRVDSLEFSSNGKYALIGVTPRHPIVLWGISKEHALPEVVLFIKLNQLGRDKVIQEPYFKDLYNNLLGY
jgi:WD40 repeat protein